MRIPSLVLFAAASVLVACGGAKPPGAPGSSAGQCVEAPAPSGADMASCKAACQGLAEDIPAGSACISPRHTCLMACDAKYSPPAG